METEITLPAESGLKISGLRIRQTKRGRNQYDRGQQTYYNRSRNKLKDFYDGRTAGTIYNQRHDEVKHRGKSRNRRYVKVRENAKCHGNAVQSRTLSFGNLLDTEHD